MKNAKKIFDQRYREIMEELGASVRNLLINEGLDIKPQVVSHKLDEMARAAVKRTIDKKAYANTADVIRRHNYDVEWAKTFAASPKLDDFQLLHRYVSALLCLKQPCPQTEADIDTIGVFADYAHKLIDEGTGTLNDIITLYNEQDPIESRGTRVGVSRAAKGWRKNSANNPANQTAAVDTTPAAPVAPVSKETEEVPASDFSFDADDDEDTVETTPEVTEPAPETTPEEDEETAEFPAYDEVETDDEETATDDSDEDDTDDALDNDSEDEFDFEDDDENPADEDDDTDTDDALDNDSEDETDDSAESDDDDNDFFSDDDDDEPVRKSSKKVKTEDDDAFDFGDDDSALDNDSEDDTENDFTSDDDDDMFSDDDDFFSNSDDEESDENETSADDKAGRDDTVWGNEAQAEEDDEEDEEDDGTKITNMDDVTYEQYMDPEMNEAFHEFSPNKILFNEDGKIGFEFGVAADTDEEDTPCSIFRNTFGEALKDYIILNQSSIDSMDEIMFQFHEAPVIRQFKKKLSKIMSNDDAMDDELTSKSEEIGDKCFYKAKTAQDVVDFINNMDKD